ncbi:MAG: hypothetical protein DRP65_04220 [Planctomycetota bacterium]|nr:MAG: hypothetical protein DRP65_04220 [Planctomycetota bacterium]
MITTGGVLISQQQAKKAEEKAQKKQMRAAAEMQAKQQEFETLAGEHWETLNKEQMELQAGAHQMNTLLELIKQEGGPERQVLTLPPAKVESPAERFNRAVDDLLRGNIGWQA